MTTFTDGPPPSVNPEPEDGSGAPDDANADDAGVTDVGSAWLRDEIQRRISAGRTVPSGGRHARRGIPAPPTGSHVPRHSVTTPGPSAPRPRPVGGQGSQASELLRRERAAAGRFTWSGPAPAGNRPDVDGAPAHRDTGPPTPVPPGEPAPPVAGSAPDAPTGDGSAPAPRRARPGVAAAAAMRGAALGRGQAKAARVARALTASAGTTSAAEAPAPAADVSAPAVPPLEPETPSGVADPTAVLPVVPDAAPGQGAVREPLPGEATPADPDDVGVAPVPPVAAEAPPTVTSPTNRFHRVVPADEPGQRPAPAPGVPPAAEQAPAGPAPADPADRGCEHVAPAPGAIRVPEQRGREEASPTGGVSEDLARKRVRVVLAERKSVAHPVRTVVDVQEGTGVGALLRTNLIGSQLAVALRFAVVAGLTLGLLPLLFAMVPEIGRIEILGIRLPWLLLGGLVYPFLFGLGLWHARTAERVEQNFADYVQD